MTPTLIGRWQTRLALLATVGAAWTAALVPLLPRPAGASLMDAYRLGFLALAITAVIGCIAWDPIYQGLQQFRWEKDWPSLYALLVGVNEGVATWLVLRQFGALHTVAFAIHFATTWLFIWFAVIGPIRVVLLRRRFIGGRVVGA